MVCLLPLLSNCIGARFLEDDETLLYKQKIEGTENVDPEDLDNLYRQEPNSRTPLIPIAPYTAFYQAGIRRYDPAALRAERDSVKQYYDTAQAQAREDGNQRMYDRLERRRRKDLNQIDRALSDGNLLMRWGEPLAVYDSSLAGQTARQMEQYLFNRGYFMGQASYSSVTRRKRTYVTYSVHEGPPYIIDSLVLVTQDTALKNVLEAHIDESLFELGDNYDAQVIEDERNRIDALLKDNGYYTFSRNYITMEVDTTTRKNRGVIIRTLISTPANRATHKVYRIDSVIVTTDANLTFPRPRQREEQGGIIYRYYEEQYAKRILARRIFLSPDDLYSRSNTLATQRQLANLDNFKFINVKYDTVGGAFTARIYTSPLPRYQISDEVGFVVSQALPGPLVNVTFTNRNIFGHLENLQTGGRFSLEGVQGLPDEEGRVSVQRSVEVNGNLSIIFPQFLLPVSEDFKRKLGYVNPRTRAQFGYTYSDQPAYDRTTVNGGITYTWQTRKGTRYSWSLWDLSLITSSVAPQYQDILDSLATFGNPLYRSFQPSLVSNSLVSATFNFLGNQASQQRAAYLRLLVDGGGLAWSVLDTTFITSRGLEYFQYLKVNADFIRYRPLRNGSVLAYRFNAGVAGSYGENQVLPFEKYFFAGGSNSIRAWNPRRLGPGSYRQEDENGEIVYSFDQQGEILLASSVEWRTDLFGFIDGALFMDVGNTWMLREDESRPGAQFKWNEFLSEFAVGFGGGLRADFGFLILRADLGIKAHDPAFEKGDRWFPAEYYQTANGFDRRKALTLNLGIGYPF